MGAEEYRDRIEVFKSGRVDFAPPAGLELTDSGRGVACWGGPKKSSNPSRESAGLDVFGGAGSALLETWFRGAMGATDCPISSSSNKLVSTFFGGADTARAGGGVLMLRFSSCCFTTLRGISSSPESSRVDGSGTPPSITHLFDSYFVLMKFSIFASDGTCPDARFASQYLFAREFPHLTILANCSSVQLSRSTDFTLLMCVPIPR